MQKAKRRPTTVTVSNGVKTVYTYDNAGRTLSLTHKKTSDNSVLLSYTPTYDSTSARLSSVAEGPTSATTSYTYDAAGRLLTENRTGANPYASTYTYNSRGLRATAFRSEGGVTSHDGTYTYDDASRLSTVTQPGVATENYTWWADSTLKTLPGQTSSYTRKLDYDEEGRLTLLQKDVSGTVTNLFEYGIGYDGKCRSTKDIDSGVWTWLPCSVASCAGELAELQSTNSGTTWTTQGVALRGKGLVRWNSDYSLTDFFGRPTAVGSSSGVTTAIYDAFNVRRGGSATLSRAAIRAILGANDDDSLLSYLNLRGQGRKQRPVVYEYPRWPIYDGRWLYWGYGNWCGEPRGKGLPIDRIDGCCMAHDNCVGSGLGAVLRYAECARQMCDCLESQGCKVGSLCWRAMRDMQMLFQCDWK